MLIIDSARWMAIKKNVLHLHMLGEKNCSSVCHYLIASQKAIDSG